MRPFIFLGWTYKKDRDVKRETDVRVSRLQENLNVNLIIEGTIIGAENYYTIPL